jgi:hypothetical protein
MAGRHILGILRLALVPALRDSRGAQDGRGRKFSSNRDTTREKNVSLRYCIALENALFFRQPSGVELRLIFDNQHSALRKTAVSIQHSAFSQTVCDPLPTGQ